jgi:hypothetical protein
LVLVVMAEHQEMLPLEVILFLVLLHQLAAVMAQANLILVLLVALAAPVVVAHAIAARQEVEPLVKAITAGVAMKLAAVVAGLVLLVVMAAVQQEIIQIPLVTVAVVYLLQFQVHQ